MKPVLKPPETKRLKLNCDILLSTSAFKFNSRRCTGGRRRRVRGFGIRQRNRRGKAVQVDPIKPVLKAPGSVLLKLRCDKLLSTFAFKLKLRRYNAAQTVGRLRQGGAGLGLQYQNPC